MRIYQYFHYLWSGYYPNSCCCYHKFSAVVPYPPGFHQVYIDLGLITIIFLDFHRKRLAPGQHKHIYTHFIECMLSLRTSKKVFSFVIFRSFPALRLPSERESRNWSIIQIEFSAQPPIFRISREKNSDDFRRDFISTLVWFMKISRLLRTLCLI